jgi:DNA-binding NarL/FixJ family response regulator
MSSKVAPRGKQRNEGSPIRVLLVDDQEVVRYGIRSLLGDEASVVVAGEARGVTEALEVADATRPTVVVTELGLPDGSGVEVTRQIVERHPQARVLILAATLDQEMLLESIRAGASGLLLKQAPADRIVATVRIIASGGCYVDPALTASVLDRLRGGASRVRRTGLASLSVQEERVFRLMGEGRSSRSIGEELHLAENTVRNYISNIYAKLGFRNRTESVAYLARESGAEPVARS